MTEMIKAIREAPRMTSKHQKNPVEGMSDRLLTQKQMEDILGFSLTTVRYFNFMTNRDTLEKLRDAQAEVAFKAGYEQGLAERSV